MRVQVTSRRIPTVLLGFLFTFVIFSGAGVVSALSTLTTGNSASIPWQEHIWGPIQNLYWLFFYDGTNYRYTTCSSVPPCNWAQPTTIISTAAAGINDMGFWIDSSQNTVYYVGSKGPASGNQFYFGRGTLGGNGIISWIPETSSTTKWPGITGLSMIRDSNGNTWAGMKDFDGSNYHFEIYYHTSTGWFSSIDIQTPGGFLVPLTSGKIAAVYNSQAVTVITCGGIQCLWSSPVTSSTTVKLSADSATHINDIVEFCHSSSTTVYYLNYAYGGLSWSQPTVVATQNGISGDCAITTDGSSNLAIAFTNEAQSTANPTATTAYTVSTNSGASWWAVPYPIQKAQYSQHQNVPPVSTTSFPLIWYLGNNAPFTIDFQVLPYIFPSGTTTTVVVPSSSSMTVGNSITYSATVTDYSPSPTSPTGNVLWDDGGAGGSFSSPSCTLAAVSQVQSQCGVTYTPPSLAGSMTITARYSGCSGTFSICSGTSALSTNKRSSSTGVSPNSASLTIGIPGSITYTASVADTSVGTASAPAGTVAWSDGNKGGTFAGAPCTLKVVSSSQSSCSVIYTPSASASAGVITIASTYSGDGAHVSSKGTSTLTISKRGTSSSVSASSSKVIRGGSVNFTITVKDSSPGTTTAPTGTVTWTASVSGGGFSAGGTCTLLAISSTQSQCNITYTAPPTAGTVKITAKYNGDSTHTGSSGMSKLTVT